MKIKNENKWITSPLTGRQYTIYAMYEDETHTKIRHWQIERKSPNGVLHKFFKSYDEAFEYLQESFKTWF